MKRNHTVLVTTLLLIVVAEVLLDVIAGDWLREQLNSTMGTIPAALGLLAVVALILARVWKYEQFTGGGRVTSFRNKKLSGWFYKNGKLDTGELLGFLVYLIFAGYAFGLWIADVAETYTWISDFAMWFIIGSAIFVFFKGKERSKTGITMTEVGAIAIAIVLPLSMVYSPLGDWLQINNYINDVGSKLIAFIISLAALLYAAKQD